MDPWGTHWDRGSGSDRKQFTIRLYTAWAIPLKPYQANLWKSYVLDRANQDIMVHRMESGWQQQISSRWEIHVCKDRLNREETAAAIIWVASFGKKRSGTSSPADLYDWVPS